MMTIADVLPELADSQLQKILLVDDKAENLIAMEAILSDCGAHLLSVSSGELALASLLDNDIALVLLDVQMPDMDGYEVLRLMRNNHRTQQIPTIFVTAYSRDEPAILNGYKAGAIDYILKPISSTILRSKVMQFLELDRYRRGLKHAYALLETQKAYYESMLNAAGEGVLGLSVDGLVTFANPTALQLLAAEPERLLGLNFLEIGLATHDTSGQWSQSVFARYCRAQRALHLTNTLLRRLDGATLPVDLSCAPLPGIASGSVVTFQDIRYHKMLEEQLRLQAVTDHLTGLANRHGFMQALQGSVRRAARHGRHVALFYIDLDHFKDINDTLGHHYGDMILRAVGERLRHAVRAQDFVARLGGDEFTVIIDDLEEPEQAASVARTMLLALNPEIPLGPQSISIGASIGISLFPDTCCDTEKLMLAADLAMYRAKCEGRNSYEFFTQELNIRAKARLMLEQGLRRGLDNQEFYLLYQPQFDLTGLKIIGIEALIRWQRKQNSVVAPSVFVPLLEQTGLINAVGEWVINQAASQRRRWCDQRVLPDDCPLAINLSPRQFSNANLLPALTNAIETYRLLPSMLEIELTEGMLMTDSKSHHQILLGLRQLGVRISIDDFGTGYSSLAYLMQFDIDALKIDKSFIDHIDHSEKDAAITASIIQLAHNLHLQVVAEGVETEAQLAVLQRLDCDFIQGYLYGRPIPEEQIVQLAAGLRGR